MNILVGSKMYTRRRIVLLIAYLFCSFLLAWTLVPGLAVPSSLLGSWGFIMGVALLNLIPELGQTMVVIVVLLSFALYLVGLLIFNNVLRRTFRFPFPIISLTIHFVGFFLSLAIWPNLLDLFPSAWTRIPPVALILAYFILDWRWALRAKEPEALVGDGPLG